MKEHILRIVLNFPGIIIYQRITMILMQEKVLDNDHYGMKDIKDRIIEALAVRNITSNTDARYYVLQDLQEQERLQ